MDLLKNRRILVLGAHSDDEVLGIGGTILKAKENDSVVDVLIVTDSASAQYKEQYKLENRGSNLHQCCDLLKVDTVFQWDLPDMRLDTLSHLELNRKLDEFILDSDYDTIFIHHPHDINKDHQILFDSLMVVCRPIPSQKVKSILTFYTPSSTEWGSFEKNRMFCPNVFVNIENTIDLKLEALSKYTDEVRDFPHPRSIENVENVAKYFGSQVGLMFAEPFCLIRLIDS
jgi:LmbE family N-acetylglucosaminyl deacetylase